MTDHDTHGEGDDVAGEAAGVAAALEGARTGAPTDVHVRTETVEVEQATAAPGEQRITTEEEQD